MKTAMTQPEYRAMKPDGESRMKVELLHRSNVKGSEGRPGQIVEVSSELGKRWIEERAAKSTKEAVMPAEIRTGTPERKALLEAGGTGLKKSNT